MKWMSDRGYKEKWLVPQNDVHIKLTRYHGNPIGNIPKFMTLNNSLNADIKRSHDRYVGMTRHLPFTNPRKFCNRTPKSIARGIKKLVESTDSGCPRGKRLIQDCDRALDVIWTVYQANGDIFQG